MNEIIEYIPDIPPTDLTLLPEQNETMLGEQFVDWLPYVPVLFYRFDWDRWN